ncbi:MAG TPA: hypothetical protein VMD99_05660 [Terriglobales bacterium]|nr:hypothetical protein [Terriglobales bacterium]
MSQSLDALLTSLESAKSRFSRGAAAETKTLLTRLSSSSNITDPQCLLRLHEALLFLRAFPQSPTLVKTIEELLNTFHQRIERLRRSGADMSVFDDFDTSGMAGTTMQDTLNFEAACWLVRRIPRHVEIAWDDYSDDYQAERAMGSTWSRLIPLLEEDADVEANIPWRSWLNAARGRERDLEFLIRSFERLPLPSRARAELYDSLRIPIRWRLENLKLSRTRNWTRPRRLFIHHEPLIQRSQISLAQELSKPAPRLTKVSRHEGESILRMVREVMLVRYRELYGTTLADPRSVVRADLHSGGGLINASRGVVMYFWNLPSDRRLPLRAYVAGFTLKNGVPINYIEAIGLCEWIEVGFNTFYTYRQGETAWIYAQALHCLHAFTGATTISIYPYQIGQNNDEALDSGAFWFYRKLGFRCGRAYLEELARREEKKIAADPQYRTPKKTLKRLAEAHMFYELRQSWKGTISSHAVDAARLSPALAADGKPGPWDTFSTRNLALRVNRRMAREFHGDSAKIRQASVKQVTRALQLNPARWTPAQRHSLENWSLILALIPELPQWSSEEKRDLLNIIQTQAAPNEMRYLRLTQQHPRLREALLHLGSP